MTALDQASLATGTAEASQARGTPQRRSRRVRLTPKTVTIFIVLVLTTAIFLFPIYWSVNTALQSTTEQQQLPLVWWPSDLQWHNLSVAWGTFPFTDYLWHTLLIVVCVTIGGVLSAACVAYGLARLQYAGRNLWFNVVLSTMMLPFIVTMIPQYLIFEQLGWLNSYWPLIVPALFGGGPVNIFLLRQFMMSIPAEIDEAAFVDGASHWQIFTRIILPMVKPALAVTAWMTALGAWGDFLGPLIYLSSPQKWTIGLGLFSFPTAQPPGYGNQLVVGIALVVMLPVVVGFFFVQRWLIEGINLTGTNR